ncbi:MAG: TlpA family protein disulfide reductase [Saprospiraceae bacterium]|nr:TlpA family protein disulfide reductase [Saprospiraceae bacterium]
MKISKIIFSVCLAYWILGCAPEITSYQLSGTIDKIEEDSSVVVLAYYNPITQKSTPLDTVRVDDSGKYHLTYEWSRPDLYRLSFPGRQSVILAIDGGQKNVVVNVEGKRNGLVEIQGSTDSEKLIGYDLFRSESKKRLIDPPYAKMREARKVGNIEKEVEAVMEYATNSKLHRKELLDYTEEKIGSSIALYGTALRWTGDDEVERLDQLVSAFENLHPGLEMTVQMREKVERFRKVAVGVKAPAMNGKNEKGDVISLVESLGEYTLLDFWASWCGPCISQIPDLKEAYASFHDQGFEIISVSVDREEEKWLNSIEKLALHWKHISDVKGWQSELAKDYNVTFIPFNFLLDSEGVIIHKNLHSKSLQTTLGDLFSSVN